MADKEVMELTKLDGSNYSMWKFGVSIALKSKDLFGFVNNTERQPEETKPEECRVYRKRSSQAEMIILASVERSLHCNLINCNSPSEMWNKLRELYGDTSIDAKQTAWEQFYSFQMNEGESVAVQLEKLESICKRLEDAGEKPTETAVISKILKSLPAKFSIFRIAWDCTPEAEKKKNNLIARLIKEDKRSSEDEVTKLALHVQKTSLKTSKKDVSKKRIEDLKKRTKCAICKEKGHWARECPEKCNKLRSELTTNNKLAYVCDIVATYSCTSDNDGDVWLADTGASMHMTFKREYFSSLRENIKNYTVKVADDRLILASGVGTIKIEETVDGQRFEREMQNVLFVPELKRNLFSVGTVNKKHFSYHSYNDRCEIRDNEGKLSSLGVPHGSLFRMCFKVKMPLECNATQLAERSNKIKLWHERMAHVNMRAVKNTCEKLGITEIANDTIDQFCEGCVIGKQTRKSYASVEKTSIFGPGEKVHSDVCGPINIESPSGSRYFLVFKDECTSYRKVYFLRHKSQVFEKFKEFEAFVARQLGSSIKVLRSDNGTEYTCDNLRNFVKEKGIIHEFSSPYVHEQNGRAEREIRTLVESARSMLLAKSVDNKLWTEAINTACYVLNRTILQPNGSLTPFEKWFNAKPTIKHLKTFGSDAYLNVPKEKRRKFDPKSHKLIMVGYEGESTNYRLWDNESRRIHVSSDVNFNENINSQNNTEEQNITLFFHADDDMVPQPPPVEVPEMQDNIEQEAQQLPEVIQEADPQDVAPVRELRDRRTINRPERYGVPVAFIADILPLTHAEAMASAEAPQWQQAINEEIKALEENNTWILTHLPPNRRAIGCKWVFAIKTNASGETRFKARLVAKGFAQREGIDYFETFAPVVRYESIRMLLAIAAKEDFEIAKFDVKTAFLYGDLKEEIYMLQAPGFINEDHKNLVCKLQRSLYGLKQSPRCWNEKFVKFLENFHFKNIESDKCVFVGRIENSIVYLALYVDDGLLISQSQRAIDMVLKYLQNIFQITISMANEFVGLEISRDRRKRLLKISQPSYINKIVERYGMSEANFSSVPAEPGLSLTRINTDQKDNNKSIPFREAIGSLLFAARVCRPDIEYAVNYLSQFINSFNRDHWQAVKRVIRYLIGTRNHGIVFGNSGSAYGLKGFTDADYAGCTESRKSRSGFVFLLNDGPISWSSQRQSIVALSTAEAEYVALANGAKEAIWLCKMLNELQIEHTTVPLFVDNQSAIKLAENAEFHKRSKHIDVRFHFVRDLVKRQDIEIKFVKSKDQLADIFTKPLSKQQFCYLRECLNIVSDSN